MGKMGSPRITYVARPNATSETELSALVAVYKFVLDCHAKREAAPESRPDDAEGCKNDRTATEIIPKPS
jgi:hypothetical protein